MFISNIISQIKTTLKGNGFYAVMHQILTDTLYINPTQAHRLVTHEDGHFFHAHKIFGILGLGHFAYRIINHAWYGTMNFNTSAWTFFFILVHAMMHVTSFQFLIPSRRNRTYNIIWPEMRWHSLIFAYRSLILMSMLYFSWLSILPIPATVYLRGPLVLLTMVTADQITEYYKRIDAIKESETTMRTNPYPSYVSPQLSRWYNLMYSTSQVFGSMNILCRDVGSVFLVLVPIQIAPFGMTLVKKGIITQAGWHFWYSLAIFVSYWYATTMERSNASGLEQFYIAGVLSFCIGRFALRMNKYVLWTIIIATQMYLLRSNARFYDAIATHAESPKIIKNI